MSFVCSVWNSPQGTVPPLLFSHLGLQAAQPSDAGSDILAVSAPLGGREQ